jgi:RHS repeat-associated protein
VASVTLPTGGKISYSYSGGNNGINCSDGSTPTLTRTTPDGTWTYAQVKGTGSVTTTTVTDPQGNQTVISFLAGYETQREVYQGLTTSGTLLRTINTCYNGATSPCTDTGFGLPITSITVLDQYGSSGLICKHVYSYNSYGLPTEQDDYDYGSGAPGALLKKSLTTYASLGNGIVSMPATTTICSPGGTASACSGSGTVVAQTIYNYDETSPTATSGIAQHASVTGSRGNLTSIDYPVSGLTGHFTYYDTGSINTSQDVNGATATYNYSNSTADCQMAFPTSITEPAVAAGSMTLSYTWNCTGGVLTQVTDENGQNLSTSYSDPYYWRPASRTDQAGNITNICYAALASGSCPTTPSTTQIETYLNFNSGNSTSDLLTSLDGLGRVHIQQTRQSPSSPNFDSVETDYDALGRPSRVTVPYVTTAGQTCPTCKAAATSYDPLSRVSSVTDGGGGTTNYTHSATSTDVSVAVGPAPSGENLKQRQLEYDGLGRLTSVCEVTTALPGNGTCAQNSSPQPSGYWTKYTYDALGDLLTVTQNAQAPSGSQQTRTYTYDAMSRLTSEANPESGTKTYVYDSDSTMCGNGAYTSAGNLVKTIDAVGNCVMRYYDALHRVTDIGTNSAVSPCKRFRYDNTSGVLGTIPSGVSVSNTLGRLVEAETDTCAAPITQSSIITDEWSNHTARGEISDVYQSTLHSGGYYHVSQTYWPNGGPNVLSSGIGLPTITYGAEGEGRQSTVSASSGQNPITATTYNLYASPYQLSVTFGSGDSDVFTFDPNTFRLNKYQFYIGTQTVSGTLGWNQNWSLGSLAISDPFSAANTQSCSFAADDLSRISQTSCGTIWGQNFTYDPFGNITKNKISGTGATSFTPTYQSSPSITNRVASVGGVSASYDANGNSLNDTFRTFTWDANSNPVTIGSVTLTYDAFDRMVEQSVSSTNLEVVYSPAGVKLALMSGTALTKAFIPLTGGDTAVYTSSGLAYYRHKDNLGSSRFASTPTQTLYADLAYSPFGEAYASSGSIDPSFTGQDQDTTSGLYDFLYREYDPNQSRWTSPDPSGLGAVDPTDPQSWNRYAYVRNRPLRYVDLLGLTCYALDDDGNITDQVTDPSIDNEADCEDSGEKGGYWLSQNTVVVVNGDDSDDGSGSGSICSYSYGGGDLLGSQCGDEFVPYVPGPTPTNQDYINAIAKGLPTVCGGGVFYYAGKDVNVGPVDGFAGYITEYDTQSGVSGGALIEAGGGEGIVGGGGYITGGNSNQGIANANLAYGGFGADTPVAGFSVGEVGFTNGAGFYAEGQVLGRERGVGAYLNITTVAGCNHH